MLCLVGNVTPFAALVMANTALPYSLVWLCYTMPIIT